MTGGSSPRPDNILNQSDIFARGKLDSDEAKYWFLLQWDGSNSSYVPYYTNQSFDEYTDKKPDVMTATANAAIWQRVRGGGTITVLGDSAADDGSGKICVSANSTVSVTDLQRLLVKGSACSISQRSWNEINKQ